MKARQLALIAFATLALTLTLVGTWRAVSNPETLSRQETARQVEQSLRCPTCQGQSLADSPSPIAEGMRQIVDQQLAAGKNADEVRAYFVARYGEWILLSPPARQATWILWLLPGFVVVGGGLLAVHVARRRSAPTTAELDLARAEKLYAAHVAGDDQPETDAVEAALLLLDSIDEESTPGENEPARTDALRRLATALAEADAGEAGKPDDDAVRSAHDRVAKSTRRLRRAVYAVAALSFAAAIAFLIVGNTGDRGNSTVSTGVNGIDPSGAPSTEALEELRQTTQQTPDDPAAWLAFGQALDAAGQPGNAIDAYLQAARLQPGNTDAVRPGAWALLRAGRGEEAIILMQPLVTADPASAEDVLLLGLAQRDAQRPEAEATLEQYLQLEPQGAMADLVRSLLPGD